MMGTAVEAPREPPSRPAMLPSAAPTTVVLNSSAPPFSFVRRITCTR